MLDYIRETITLIIAGAVLAFIGAIVTVFAPIIALFTIDK